MILGLALIESLVIYAFVIAIMIVVKIPDVETFFRWSPVRHVSAVIRPLNSVERVASAALASLAPSSTIGVWPTQRPQLNAALPRGFERWSYWDLLSC